ncbi:MAG: RHS repeat-associated core domain-containing protein [Pseudomonadota bacterium]
MVFSEPVDTTQLARVFTIDGASATWTVTAEGYGLETTLPNGQHALTASLSDPLDLAAKPLDHPSATIGTFTIASDGCGVLHAESENGLLAASTVGNVHGFHGRPHDAETGFVYIRNRYYDPELGRFITTDPLGYVDGPSAYAFVMNSPVNYGDPFGLYVVSDQVVSIEEYLAELRLIEAALLAKKRAGDPNAEITALEIMKYQLRLLKNAVDRRVGGRISDNRFVIIGDFPVDMKHFLQVAMLGEKYGYMKAQWGAYGDEFGQFLHESEGTRLSALSPEDMPSNFLGAHFGGKRFDSGGGSLADQLEREFDHIERWNVIWGVYGTVPEVNSPEWLETFDYDINLQKEVPPRRSIEDFNWLQQQLIKKAAEAKTDHRKNKQ